ncbi:aminotransferase family protein [Kutzneria sp. CA-103260]|uniref:aminotransferase family protein n=1 Tax=Kutzneria sp. CA-103260 TaxID=2802641 RepID=UPI001BAA5672|nr:aminotransferase class III-fold pyridoxal phosphate-dependent enzyme [Kutzneria sp. CA-103260]QUQ67488.1 acetylornithine aminotransferase [Kutzneria sp. CA-103260]
MSSATPTSTFWRPWTPVAAATDPVVMVEGRGTRVRDADGTWYVDGISGMMNASCGHGHPRLLQAAARQLEQLAHFELSAFTHPAAEALAAGLARLLPGDLGETFLVNSGSEATEAAMRIVSQYWRNMGAPRDRVITFQAGYHGSTALAQKLSGLPSNASDWAAPFPIDHVRLPVPPRELRSAGGAEALAGAFATALAAGPPAAAVMVEPLLNVGGGIVLPAGFLTELRRLCDQYGTLLVLDEVFCGFGRTGRMFGFDHDGVTPDLVTMSKGISGGYVPLAAVSTTPEIKGSFRHEPMIGGLRYGHTTSGHAVACAVAAETLEVIADEGLVGNAKVRGSELLSGLRELEDHPSVIDVRGLGLVATIEVDEQETASAVVAEARRGGLIIRSQGTAIMVMPPLITTAADVAETVQLMAQALARVTSSADHRLHAVHQ